MKRIITLLTAALFTSSAFGMGMDAADPLVTLVKFHRLEAQKTDEATLGHWDLEVTAGYDLNKVRLQSEGHTHEGEVEESEVQLFYQRAVDPWWDLLIGLRSETRPEPSENWFALGLVGTAPWQIDTQATLYLRDGGQQALRLTAESEYLFTQRVQLLPSLESNLYSQADPTRGVGKGLADLTLGLRLAYEVKREFAPYLGYQWSGLFGDTADQAEAGGEETSESAWVVGIHAWF